MGSINERFTLLGLAATLGMASLAAHVFAADTYILKGDQEVVVFEHEGKLYCRRSNDDFEMCNGMTQSDDGKWRGENMRHPDMPSFMKFNGTVTFSDAGLNIEGCALGICDAEDWTKQ